MAVPPGFSEALVVVLFWALFFDVSGGIGRPLLLQFRVSRLCSGLCSSWSGVWRAGWTLLAASELWFVDVLSALLVLEGRVGSLILALHFFPILLVEFFYDFARLLPISHAGVIVVFFPLLLDLYVLAG